MNRRSQPPDEIRRRVLLGLGAIGAGAIGARVVLSGDPGSDSIVEGARPGEPPAASSSDRPTTTRLATNDDAAATPVPEKSTTPSTAPVTSVVVACRDAWRADPVSGVMVEHVPMRLTLHHTAVSQEAPNQGPARARQHQRYHQSLGWPDLAYHFLVDRSGLAYEGRDLRYRGDTATEYDPTGHFLVCMEGDFDAQQPTAEQLATTVALFAWASHQYDIDAATLAGHGAYADTSCPGSSVSAMIPELAAAVAGTGRVGIDLVCGPNGSQLVAELEAG